MKHALALFAVLGSLGVGCADGAAAPTAPPPVKPAQPAAPAAAPPPGPTAAPEPTPAAAPAPAPPPAAPPTSPAPATGDASCKPGGKVVFEIDHRIEPGAKVGTSTSKLYASGAWTHDETDGDGKAQPQTTGCLGKAAADDVGAALKAAPWKITMARIRCMAMSPQYVEFLVAGKRVYTQKLCSGQTLDDKSRAALDKAIAQLEPPAGAKP
jgi:hypothetical protein